jgi:hypothetical protein
MDFITESDDGDSPRKKIKIDELAKKNGYIHILL